jgi:hypothetical protein
MLKYNHLLTQETQMLNLSKLKDLQKSYEDDALSAAISSIESVLPTRNDNQVVANTPEVQATKKPLMSKLHGQVFPVAQWAQTGGKHLFDAIAAVDSNGRRNRLGEVLTDSKHKGTRAVSSYGLKPIDIYDLAINNKDLRESDLGKTIVHLRSHFKNLEDFGRAINKLTSEPGIDDLLMQHHMESLMQRLKRYGGGDIEPKKKFEALVFAHKYGPFVAGIAVKLNKDINSVDRSGYVKKVLENMVDETESCRIAMHNRHSYYNLNQNSLPQMKVQDSSALEGDELKKSKAGNLLSYIAAGGALLGAAPYAGRIAHTIHRMSTPPVGVEGHPYSGGTARPSTGFSLPSFSVPDLPGKFLEATPEPDYEPEYKPRDEIRPIGGSLKHSTWFNSPNYSFVDKIAAVESSGHKNRIHPLITDPTSGHHGMRAVSSYGIMPNTALTLTRTHKELGNSPLGKKILNVHSAYGHNKALFGSKINELTSNQDNDDLLMHYQLEDLSSSAEKLGFKPGTKEHEHAMAYGHYYGTGKGGNKFKGLSGAVSAGGPSGIHKFDHHKYVRGSFNKHHSHHTSKIGQASHQFRTNRHAKGEENEQKQ